MKRIAFGIGARHRRVKKAQVERGVVPNQNRALAVMRFEGSANFFEDALQSVFFVNRWAQRVIGVDACDGQRGGFDVGTVKGFDMKGVGFAAAKYPVRVNIDEYRCNLQQRIFGGIESASLNVNHHR